MQSKVKEIVIHPTPIKRQVRLTQLDRDILWWLTEGDHLASMQPVDRDEVLRINSSTVEISREERRFMRATVRSMGIEPDDLWAGVHHGDDPNVKPARRYRSFVR